MPAITTEEGTQIYYKDWGPKDAQPVVFHHGWPLSADDWDAQMLFFVGKGYRVVAHDRRGHGRSTQVGDGHDMDHYAAGDVANFYNPALDKRLRVEHEDNANTMGRLAGQAMAGRAVTYDHLPFFYSDLFELGYEAVGEVDSRLETVADWKEPYREGVVYYLRDGRVRGVLLWNVWDQVNAARKLIAERGPFRRESLKGRLPA